MKLGYIDYLNCYPFYYKMFEQEPISDVQIIPGYPGDLNRWMTEGELNMSPISAAAYSDIQENVFILPQFCLSSMGYVRSVVLYSRVPIEELSHKTVGLTSASKTSVILLKILLEKYYNLKPEYKIVEPNPNLNEIDAALVIGNEAMVERDEPIEYVYDLGDLWMRKTGHPVVFALFAIQKDFFSQAKDLSYKIIDSFQHSLDFLNKNESIVIEKASKKYPDIKYDISKYYSLLKFHLTDELKTAVEFYFNEAATLGFLKPVKKINYIGLK